MTESHPCCNLSAYKRQLGRGGVERKDPDVHASAGFLYRRMDLYLCTYVQGCACTMNAYKHMCMWLRIGFSFCERKRFKRVYDISWEGGIEATMAIRG